MSANDFTFNDLVEKALSDPAFRKGLVEDPASTLESAGMDAPDKLVTALEKVDWVSLERVVAAFGSGDRTDTAVIC
ncbi:MAG: hypothetical protein KJO11_01685 [Gemmatimonadetes bacterium]|nr:hypothetical protein [Gemmatimonadota bacterium]MBT8403011.1 hypothetical protein [Gemmatimonadota bacterium]NNF37973.1 hypothetical protein [Gemmatimonadota bacterium]NNK62393.1 hypothetical protein [Gemmatimonadota bacterium]